MPAYTPDIIVESARSEEPPVRACDHPGCTAGGAHRAPRSPHEIGSYYWFCLEHVRAYNAAWNFFTGMSRGEIEDFQHADLTWHRPTWRWGPRAPFARLWDGERVADPYGFFAEADAAWRAAAAPPPADERDALATLDLAPGAGRAEIKARYKALVKRFHPDANGGDRTAEGRLRAVIAAYRRLVHRAAG